MASQVSICSNALLMLGAKTINSLSDTSDRAVLCLNLYPQVRDSVLRSHNWNCCIARAALAPDADAPLYDYINSFTLPADWLRTICVGQYGYESDFKSEGRKILCDDDVLYLRYIARVDESLWHEGLVEAVTLAMAEALAYPITQSASMQQGMAQKYQMAMKRIRAEDGQEDPPETLGDFRLLASRYSSSSNF